MNVRKNQNYFKKQYKSTSDSPAFAYLGTIEKDACEHYGPFEKKPFLGFDGINKILEIDDWVTAIDIGAGSCNQATYVIDKSNNQKKVYTNDLINNRESCIDGQYRLNSNINNSEYDYPGDFLEIDFLKKFDCVFAIHVLEHQLNIQKFLNKLISITKKEGYILITVPIRKPYVISGHMTIWNAGLVLYNLVIAGIDCSKFCKILQSDYDISIIVKNIKNNYKPESLHRDSGDLRKLKNFFPSQIRDEISENDCFDGDIFELNWRGKK